MHRRRESVVGRLRHIHIVVGVNGSFGAHFTARHFDRSIRDDFVDVHIGLRPGTRLPNTQGKLGHEDTVGDLSCGTFDQVRLVIRQLS